MPRSPKLYFNLTFPDQTVVYISYFPCVLCVPSRSVWAGRKNL